MHRELQEWIQASSQEDEQKNVKAACSTQCKKMISIQRPRCGVSNMSQIAHGPEEVGAEDSSEQPLDRLLTWTSLNSQKGRLVYDLCPKVQFELSCDQ